MSQSWEDVWEASTNTELKVTASLRLAMSMAAPPFYDKHDTVTQIPDILQFFIHLNCTLRQDGRTWVPETSTKTLNALKSKSISLTFPTQDTSCTTPPVQPTSSILLSPARHVADAHGSSRVVCRRYISDLQTCVAQAWRVAPWHRHGEASHGLSVSVCDLCLS